MAVQTERSKVRTKPTKCQYSPVRLELARLVSSLLYGTRAMLVLNFPAFKSKKYTAVDCFHGDSTYGKILTNKGPIRTLRCTLPFNNSILFNFLSLLNEWFLKNTINTSKLFWPLTLRLEPLLPSERELED